MKALILGIGGQDGSYLADVLLEQGAEVHGLYRHASYDNLTRITHCRDRLTLHRGDLTDLTTLQRVIRDAAPDEIYNAADQDHVGWSAQIPLVNWDVTSKAVAGLLEVVRQTRPAARVYQPISSTVFGLAKHYQCEDTPLNPLSHYACCKAAAWHACRYYRQVYGLFVCCAVLYNHDSPRRKPGYLLQDLLAKARKVTTGEAETLSVGAMDQIVDIGYAREYAEAACRMLRYDAPLDYIICSGSIWTIAGVARECLRQLGVSGAGELVVEDPGLGNPGPVPTLAGDGRRAEQLLGWRAETKIPDLIHMLLTSAERART